MKNRFLIIIIIIVGIVLSSTLVIYLAYLDEPKTPWDCRIKYGKVKQDIQNCIDRIKDEEQGFPQNKNVVNKDKIESDFLNKIRETGNNSEPMTFTIISKQDDGPTRHENYCGHVHMAVEEYWYFADVYNGELLSSNVTQDISPWCEEGEDSCYCELREVIGMDRQSYEDFFRMHVSETCPITLMPESVNGMSFDPVKCEWIENEE